MNPKKIIVLLAIMSLIIIFYTPVVLAQTDSSSGGSTPDSSSGGSTGSGLQNPLNFDDPRMIIGNVIRALLGVVGSLALGVFILGGFTWVTSAGNEERIKKGKDMVMWAAFGLAMIFMSYALVTFVIGALVGSTGGSTSTSSSAADTTGSRNIFDDPGWD